MKIAPSLILISLFVLAVSISIASGQPPLPALPQQTPIDGGLSGVALACGAYALRRIRNAVKK